MYDIEVYAESMNRIAVRIWERDWREGDYSITSTLTIKEARELINEIETAIEAIDD